MLKKLAKKKMDITEATDLLAGCNTEEEVKEKLKQRKAASASKDSTATPSVAQESASVSSDQKV